MSESVRKSLRNRHWQRSDRDGLRVLLVEVGLEGHLDRSRRPGRWELARQLRVRLPESRAPSGRAGDGRQGPQEPVPAQFAVRDQAEARPDALVVAAPLRQALQRTRHDRGRPGNPAAAPVLARALSGIGRTRVPRLRVRRARAPVRLPIESRTRVVCRDRSADGRNLPLPGPSPRWRRTCRPRARLEARAGRRLVL